MTSSTMRDAVMIATTLWASEDVHHLEMEDLITQWRQWLIENWEIDPTKTQPF